MTTLAAHIATAETAAKQAWTEARERRDTAPDDDRTRRIVALLAAGYDQIQRAGKLAGEDGGDR